MKKSLLLIPFVLSFSTLASAMDVCELKKSGSFGTEVSGSDKDQYLKKLEAECDLATKYKKAEKGAKKKFSLRLDQMSVYQALRYVDREYYASAAFYQNPVKLIYQRTLALRDGPQENKSDEIWRNWVAGIPQLEVFKNKVLQGQNLTVEDLKKAHVGFYTVSSESGDFAHEPVPGVFKEPAPTGHRPPWWPLSDEAEGLKSVQSVAQINSIFKSAGLIANDKNDALILEVKKIQDGRYAVFSAEPKYSETNIGSLISLLNTQLGKARAGQHMQINGRLITPGELAFLAQQYFTDVHPFHEGNGRMSRFIQELVLTSFEMPTGASGDLMKVDVLTPQPEYYRLAMEKTASLLNEVNDCLNRVYPAITEQSKQKVAEMDQQKIEYKCRILN